MNTTLFYKTISSIPEDPGIKLGQEEGGLGFAAILGPTGRYSKVTITRTQIDTAPPEIKMDREERVDEGPQPGPNSSQNEGLKDYFMQFFQSDMLGFVDHSEDLINERRLEDAFNFISFHFTQFEEVLVDIIVMDCEEGVRGDMSRKIEENEALFQEVKILLLDKYFEKLKEEWVNALLLTSLAHEDLLRRAGLNDDNSCCAYLLTNCSSSRVSALESLYELAQRQLFIITGLGSERLGQLIQIMEESIAPL